MRAFARVLFWTVLALTVQACSATIEFRADGINPIPPLRDITVMYEDWSRGCYYSAPYTRPVQRQGVWVRAFVCDEGFEYPFAAVIGGRQLEGRGPGPRDLVDCRIRRRFDGADSLNLPVYNCEIYRNQRPVSQLVPMAPGFGLAFFFFCRSRLQCAYYGIPYW